MKTKITLINDNYFSPEANLAYWSSSQFKAFSKCEAAGLAEAQGKYERTETEALLIGKYVDAYFSGEMEEFREGQGNKLFTNKGELYAKFKHADEIIARVERDNLMMRYLSGIPQKIVTAEMFGVPWKIKMDVFSGTKIVDLKCVKDFKPIYEEGFGYRPWLEYWGYDIQGAIYQKVEQISSGRDKPLPFYIAAVTKETVPDIAVIQIPQHILDAALRVVEAKIERFDLIKTGEVEPKRCEKCDYCKETKVLTAPEVYEIEEA